MTEKSNGRLLKNKRDRQRLFPKVTDKEIWDWSKEQQKKGFITIPRTLPYFLNIMDEAAEKPVSSTYIALWCRLWDQSGLIKIDSQDDLAFESGFSGQRKIQTWRSRIKILIDLGFILTAPLKDDPFGYVLILNPYSVVKQKYNMGKYLGTYSALVYRADSLKATDLNDDN